MALGRVIFIGAGPGSADLITVRGWRRPTWCCSTR